MFHVKGSVVRPAPDRWTTYDFEPPLRAISDITQWICFPVIVMLFQSEHLNLDTSHWASKLLFVIFSVFQIISHLTMVHLLSQKPPNAGFMTSHLIDLPHSPSTGIWCCWALEWSPKKLHSNISDSVSLTSLTLERQFATDCPCSAGDHLLLV